MDEITKARLDWFKLEYERSAQRYNDLYVNIWTIFNYMAVVAGALMSFSGLPIDLKILAATIPLTFWYRATYKPLDRYGDALAHRLGEIEEAVEALAFADPGIPDAQTPHHFRGFVQFREKNRKHRVRSVMRWSAWVVLMIDVLVVGARCTSRWTGGSIADVLDQPPHRQEASVTVQGPGTADLAAGLRDIAQSLRSISGELARQKGDSRATSPK